MKHPLQFLVFAAAMAAPLAGFAQTEEIRVAPPSILQVERRPPSPGANYEWTPGYWRWRHHRYEWAHGVWQRPARPGTSWYAPHWEREGRGWRFAPGTWVGTDVHHAPPGVVPPTPGTLVTPRQFGGGIPVANPQPVANPPSTGTIEIGVAPPAAVSEVQTRSPGRDYIWTPGYWSWQNSRHVWVFGSWQRPMRRGQVWVTPRWQQRGLRWQFVPGGWRGVIR